MAQTTDSKPKPRKVRGTGTYVGDEFTFTPYEQGEPTQRNVKTTKGGKVYETCSEKKPMKVAYLTCAFSLLLVSQTSPALQTKQAAGCGHAQSTVPCVPRGHRKNQKRRLIHSGKGRALMV